MHGTNIKILYRMLASIPRLQSAPNFLMNDILTCQGRSQISEPVHPFKRFTTYLQGCDFVPACRYTLQNLLDKVQSSLCKSPLTAHIYIICFSEVPSVQFLTGLVQQFMTYLNFRYNDSSVT